MGHVAALDREEDFDQLVRGSAPVLVDFTATWCGPCRRLAPILDEIAAELGAGLTVLKVDVDENEGIARRYDVQGVPTLMLFRGGERLTTLVGAKSKPELLAELETHLGSRA